jgi:hypothetical protein
VSSKGRSQGCFWAPWPLQVCQPFPRGRAAGWRGTCFCLVWKISKSVNNSRFNSLLLPRRNLCPLQEGLMRQENCDVLLCHLFDTRAYKMQNVTQRNIPPAGCPVAHTYNPRYSRRQGSRGSQFETSPRQTVLKTLSWKKSITHRKELVELKQ